MSSAAVSTAAAPADLYWTEYRYSNTDPEAIFNELFSVHRASVADVAGTQVELIHSLGYQPEYKGLGAAYSVSYVREFGEPTVNQYTFVGDPSMYSPLAAADAGGFAFNAQEDTTYIPGGNGEGNIYRGDFERENQQLLVATEPFHSISVALDEPRGHIYWLGTCNGCNLMLGRANLDGTGAQAQILPVIGDDYSTDLAIDSAAGKLYWNNQYTQSIQRANLDGTNIEDILTSVTVFSLAIDPQPIPEPGAFILAVVGVAFLSIAVRRGRRFN